MYFGVWVLYIYVYIYIKPVWMLVAGKGILRHNNYIMLFLYFSEKY